MSDRAIAWLIAISIVTVGLGVFAGVLRVWSLFNGS